jgi:hypothetical protein
MNAQYINSYVVKFDDTPCVIYLVVTEVRTQPQHTLSTTNSQKISCVPSAEGGKNTRN